MSLLQALATPRGRWLRGILGLALVLIGWFFLWNHGGIIVALAGLTLILAAVNDVCLLAALFGQPISGGWLRRHTHAHG